MYNLSMKWKARQHIFYFVLVGTSLHTFLILLQLAIMNIGAIADGIKGGLAWISKSKTCEEDSVHMINEIRL